jgi:hypothetical protein
MYRCIFYNFGYESERQFRSYEEAFKFGKAQCFEFQVLGPNNQIIASWGPIRGTTYYGQVPVPRDTCAA